MIIELGGGRKVMTDRVDHSVGLELLVRIGDYVDAGKPILRVFASREQCEAVRDAASAAFTFADQPVVELPLVVDWIE